VDDLKTNALRKTANVYSPAALDTLQRRLIGRLCIAASGLHAELDRELTRITTAVRQPCHGQTITELTEALSRVITRLPEQHGPARATQLLEHLLKRIEVSAALQKRADDLRERAAADDAAPLAIADDLADLLGAQQALHRHEKADAQRMLLQVTGRLDEMSAYLRATADDRRHAEDSGRALDSRLRIEMQALDEQSRSAQALEELQQQVQCRLEQLGEHLQAYRSQERSRWQEQQRRSDQLLRRIDELESTTSALRDSAERGRQLAMTDALTGIANRLAYDERMRAEFAQRAGGDRREHAITICDIDHFKSINDQWGHACGDKLLRAVATMLARQLRTGDFIARYGGEEFVVLFADTPLDTVQQRSDHLRQTIEQIDFRVGGQRLAVTMSCGIARALAGDTAESLFERADQALYAAKRSGRNRCATAPETGAGQP
jgi:diguanylate cyclase